MRGVNGLKISLNRVGEGRVARSAGEKIVLVSFSLQALLFLGNSLLVLPAVSHPFLSCPFKFKLIRCQELQTRDFIITIILHLPLGFKSSLYSKYLQALTYPNHHYRQRPGHDTGNNAPLLFANSVWVSRTVVRCSTN